MFEFIKGFFKQQSLSSFDSAITREKLIQNGRIVVIDDEEPLLIDELLKAGFAVDHDKDGDDLHKLDNQLYDVAIIDFHGVGKRLGQGQGLDLLKHVRRVSPRTRLIGHTSRSLSSSESEFFRLSHVVLPKDLGLGESMAIVEEQLRLAFTKSHLFEALITKLNCANQDEKLRIQDALIKALGKRDESKFKEYLSKLVGSAAEKSVEIIIDKLF